MGIFEGKGILGIFEGILGIFEGSREILGVLKSTCRGREEREGLWACSTTTIFNAIIIHTSFIIRIPSIISDTLNNILETKYILLWELRN